MQSDGPVDSSAMKVSTLLLTTVDPLSGRGLIHSTDTQSEQ